MQKGLEDVFEIENLREQGKFSSTLDQEEDDELLEDLLDLVDEEGGNDCSALMNDQNGVEKLRAFARIEHSEKREYLQALDEVPHLVQTETPWEDFMWTENQNADRAALRMARYWKARKHCFGEERWLRPLNQTGTGALWPVDIEVLVPVPRTLPSKTLPQQKMTTIMNAPS